MKTSWEWSGGHQCYIDSGKTLHVTDGFGGASCSLRDFLRGELTWHLPDGVRREALATAQAILKVRGPLPAAVLRGDIDELVPEVGAARDRLLAEQRARDAESARLAKFVEAADLPDPQCTICRGLMEKFEKNRREFERLMGSVFPHDGHPAALRAVDRRLDELRSGTKDAACATCRALASPTRATRRTPLPSEAQPIVALPALFHVPGTVSAADYVRCAECGSVWRVADFHEFDDDTDDSTTVCVQLANLHSVRSGLETLLHRGTVPDWLAAVIQQA